MFTGTADSGSFRDRDGRIYLHGERVFRSLSEFALKNFRVVSKTTFYRKFSESGSLVRTAELDVKENPLPEQTQKQWVGFLEHERVEIISYPYEWTFGMLKAAALLQLQLAEAAIGEGFTLKDATPYNVQFVGAKPGTVWDIGCNTGQFARIAAQHCRQVVATDIDHFAVERLYRDPRTPANVLALVQDVANPSPNWGWRNRERRDLQTRSQPGMVLYLALIHHVVITANIPLAEFIDWLAGLSDQLVIEYVPRADDKVLTLLRNKEDKYWDYHRDYLEQQLEHHYRIRERIELREGQRLLYWCHKPA